MWEHWSASPGVELFDMCVACTLGVIASGVKVAFCRVAVQVPGRVDVLRLPHRQRVAVGYQTLRQPAEQSNLPATQSHGSRA